MAIARNHQAAFVPEVRDAWPDSLVELSGLPRGHPLVAICSHLARRAFRSATLVTSSLPGVNKHVEQVGGGVARTILIPNGTDIQPPEVRKVPPLIEDALHSAASKGQRVLLYAGAMGPPNALHQLVQAVTLLPTGDRARLVCILIGDGTERRRLYSLASSLTPEIKFVGTYSQDVVAAVMPRCHAGFIGWLNRPLYRFGVSPQKLAMMLGGGLPVIHAIPDGLEAWAQALPGWYCRAEDPPSLARAITQMLGTPSGDLDRLRHASIDCANDKFDWNRIAAASLEELSQL